MERAILLVEDNEDDIALTLRALNKSHLSNDIVVARDGREALDYLENAKANGDRLPVLVLLDLRLPRVDGIEVLRRIRADDATKDMPVLIMTSSCDEEDRLRGEQYGAASFMVKPGDYDQLVAAVKKLGLYWAVSDPPTPRQDYTNELGIFFRYASRLFHLGLQAVDGQRESEK